MLNLNIKGKHLMRIKYNRTSTINQHGERFKLDKENYDYTLNDFGVRGKIPFKDKTTEKLL